MDAISRHGIRRAELQAVDHPNAVGDLSQLLLSTATEVATSIAPTRPKRTSLASYSATSACNITSNPERVAKRASALIVERTGAAHGRWHHLLSIFWDKLYLRVRRLIFKPLFHPSPSRSINNLLKFVLRTSPFKNVGSGPRGGRVKRALPSWMPPKRKVWSD